MATPNIPRDETNKTLVTADDQHLHHAKDLLVTPSKASTGVSSGTVSAEEPSTPVESSADHHLPTRMAKFMATEGPDGQPPWGVKNFAAMTEGPDGQPPWGTKGFAVGAPMGDGSSGWPQGDGPKQEGTVSALGDGSSGWPQDDSPKNGTVSAAGGDSNSGWPQDDSPKESAVRRERAPGTVGPEGQPPWGVKSLAAGGDAGPDGQPPWGVKNLAAKAAAGPDGQPPWGIKNLAAAANGDAAPRKDA